MKFVCYTEFSGLAFKGDSTSRYLLFRTVKCLKNGG